MTSLVDRLWYGKSRPLRFLAPLSWLYLAIAASRRRKAWRAMDGSLPVPVIVIGNITAGGTGKSPLTSWLATELKAAGWQPVIISRGYGGKSSRYPLLVNPDTDPAVAGDEPVMLAQSTGCPVVVDPQRKRGANWALGQKLGNILICDDGLQHYSLPRDIELAVFDGVRGIGNGAIIPVGPLREPVSRLSSVDYVVINGGGTVPGDALDSFRGIEHPQIHAMALEPLSLVHVKTGKTRAVNELHGQSVRAVAGIGNPGRFFDTLKGLGALVEEVPFSDHHGFKASDLKTSPGQWLLMTSKDAVKCRKIAPDNAWALPVHARMSPEFLAQIMSDIRNCSEQITS
ncbi:MAG TPA: tetraacyldisaccharide 4'-kinase [Marinobacter sp.]|nr:tetraacyldisaccharide 4'-kinase [Marinobacter sp.]